MKRTVFGIAGVLLALMVLAGCFSLGETSKAAIPERKDRSAYREKRSVVSTSQIISVVMLIFSLITVRKKRALAEGWGNG